MVFNAVNDNAVFKLMAQAEKRLLASRRQHFDALAARDQRACTCVNASPALDGFPNPPDHHRQDDPWQQGPEQHNSQKQHKRRNGHALGERLGFVGHHLPTGDQGHGGGIDQCVLPTDSADALATEWSPVP
jgi:hypothetical protein